MSAPRRKMCCVALSCPPRLQAVGKRIPFAFLADAQQQFEQR